MGNILEVKNSISDTTDPSSVFSKIATVESDMNANVQSINQNIGGPGPALREEIASLKAKDDTQETKLQAETDLIKQLLTTLSEKTDISFQENTQDLIGGLEDNKNLIETKFTELNTKVDDTENTL